VSWGDGRDRDERRPAPTGFDGVIEGLRSVPRWVWITLAVFVFIGLSVALRGVPVFLLIFFLIFAGNKSGRFRSFFGGHGRRGHRHGHAPHRGAQAPNRPGGAPPTVRWGEPGATKFRSDDSVADPALRESLARGRELATRLRSALAGISDREIRLRATNLADDADRILGSVRERGDVAMADLFNDRYLAPATTIMTRYARLAPRDLTTARPALERVEQHDLPLLQKRFDQFYEQVHRGDLIDLEVASEMLAFELGAPVNGRPSLDQPDPPVAERRLDGNGTGTSEPVRWRGDSRRDGGQGG
jgi:hypothetical protein